MIVSVLPVLCRSEDTSLVGAELEGSNINKEENVEVWLSCMCTDVTTHEFWCI